VGNRSFKQHQRRWETAGVVLLAVVTLVATSLALLRSSALPAAGPMPTSTWTPSIAKPSPVAVFIGDSYTAPAGGGIVMWTTLVAAKKGWLEVNLGRGGTGYGSYGQVIPDAVKAKPDLVMVAGGRNDGSVDSLAIRTFYQDLRAQLPNAKIYAMSPLWDSTAAPAFIALQGHEVEAAVKAVGGTFLDVGQPFQGRPELITNDHVHPNATGHQVLAQAVSELLV